jgi:CRISPR-associated protein Csx17
MILHRLDGCAPTPLAHYLKALGILRLVAEQADPEARGWWGGERFLFASSLNENELLAFFLERYAPTPLLAPWNGASGFFRTWDPKKKQLRRSKNAKALETLIAQETDRWKVFKAAHKDAETALAGVLQNIDVASLPEKERKRLLIVPRGSGPVFPVANKDSDKPQIQRALAWACSENPLFRSAIVDMGDEFKYPSLWGSGCNDGAIDFTARYFECLVALFVESDKQTTQSWLKLACFGFPSAGLLSGAAGKVGQFLPGGAGGANTTNGPGSQDDTLLNPWDFVFMLEGALLFTAGAARRLQAKQQSRAAAPFAIGGQGAGYASASESDESARGEQWMPLWSQPLSLAELKHLLVEGRAQLGARSVSEPLDLARAVARLGTARGITAFQRYGYIERNGQSNLAVPLGRFVVLNSSSLQLRCLDDLDAWLPRLRGEARSKGAPTRFAMAEHRLAETLLGVTQHPDEPSRWQAVLLRLADIEAVQVTGSGYKAGPVPRLRPEWVKAADDGLSEFRLALACALQCAGFNREGLPIDSDSVRRHWLPLDRTRYATSGIGAQTRLQIGSDCVMHGRSGLDDAIALLERRLIEAARRGARRLPLVAAYRAAASPTDISRFIVGEVDADRTMRMARALMALDSKAWVRSPCPARAVAQSELPDDAWLAIRLALLPWPMQDGRSIGADPAILRRLVSGDASSAVDLARRRLRAAGITTTVRVATASPEIARRWAAALAFPITRKAASRFVKRLDPHSLKETQYER